MSGKNILGVEESRKTDGRGVGDLPSAIKHEPLDASLGVQIIVREYKQENERLKEEVAILEAQCNTKDEKIAYFEEMLSAKDKEIADLKEKLSELQQKSQEKEVDFAKQLKTMDEKLNIFQNIFQARENILKKKAEVEKLPNEEQLFNAKDCFDRQPSWFDTLLPSDIGCLEVDNYPVQASDLDAKNTDGSFDKPLKPKDSEAAKGNASCSILQRILQHPPQPVFLPVKGALTPPAGQNKPLPGEDVEAKAVASIQTTPVSKAAKVPAEGYQLKNQPPSTAVAHFNTKTEVDMADTPVAGKDSVDSTKTDDATPSQPNPFRKVKGKVRQLQPPPPLLFVPGASAVTPPPVGQNRPLLGEDLKPDYKAVNSVQTTPVNPFRRAARGKVRQLQPPSPLFMPVKAAGRPSAGGQNRPPIGRAVKANYVNGTPTAMPVNPFSKAAKGGGYIHHRPLPFVPATTVLDGSKMGNTYPANAFAQSVTPFPHIEKQGFLSRTFNKWFGY